MNATTSRCVVRAARGGFGGVVCAGVFVAIALAVCAPREVAAQEPQELFINGDLALGGVGWFVATTDDNDPDNGIATWFLGEVGAPSPLNGLDTSTDGNAEDLYLVTDQQIVSRVAVFQVITIPAASEYERIRLSFDMYVNDYANVASFNPDQYVTVDVMSATADPLDLTNGIIYNAYAGTDGGPLPNPFFHHTHDITGFVEPEQEYVVRFLANVNVAVLNVGLDNVSVIASIPEPSCLSLLLAGLLIGSYDVRRRSAVQLNT